MRPKLIVTDLDNTLYDWVAYFVPSFYAMVDKAVDLIGCDRELLLDDFRDVHRRHHDSEHPFALLETRIVRERFGGLTRPQVEERLNEAFHAFNSTRKATLRLYPGVEEALQRIRSMGIRLVAHTESKLTGVVDRLTRLNIADNFDAIFCIERPTFDESLSGRRWNRLDNFPMQKVRELSHHQRKPDPTVLAEICRSSKVGPDATMYVGDSLTRDVLLARRAGVFAVWAKYGTNNDPAIYDRLVRVSHWTTADVERERELRTQAGQLVPDLVLERGFDELLPVIEQ